MNQESTNNRQRQIFSILEIACIVGLALVPLFSTFPYRVNIFLSWEGAYRISQGQIPYRDFGMPLGYMYWVVPALFFKIFGPQLITLVKAQVFINIVSGLAFRSIFKSLAVPPGIRLLSVLLYCVSYSFFNFWPWYNHTVIVYGMVALAFLMRYLMGTKKPWWLLSAAALFVFFSFFTKQDGGGLSLLLCLALLLYHCWVERSWKDLGIFLLSLAVSAFALIAPLLRYNFGYWFNHGQPPHTARVSLFEIVDELMSGSQWIKFYLLLVLVFALVEFRPMAQFRRNKSTGLLFLLTIGILVEAAILQVTSYTPPDNNIFYHSFAFAFVLVMLGRHLRLSFQQWPVLLATAACLLFWWSGVFWRYLHRVVAGFAPSTATVSPTGENVVNRRTYMLLPQTTAEIPASEWTFSRLPSFQKIYMPAPTVQGIDRLMQLPEAKAKGRILNMTELTPLAAEVPFQLETGTDIPLWYHLGVGMFNREAALFEKKIQQQQYDLVLFEHIPTLNNFYPFRTRAVLQQHYQQIDSFPAPRRGAETQGMIEIYRRRH